MKRLLGLGLIILMLAIGSNAYSADIAISALPDGNANVTFDDLFVIVNSPGTTPATQKATVGASHRVRVSKPTAASVAVANPAEFELYINGDDDAITFTLPADPTGVSVCFANLLYAQIITVTPDGSDYIVRNGVTAAAGESYVSTAARNAVICMVGVDTSYWLVTGSIGTWAEATPP